jgi:hypothetical protein
VVATKKILVIILIVVLASSVAAGASSLFRGTPSRVEEQDINTQLNRVVDFCIGKLPAGIPECDSQLRELVDNACRANGNALDACKNDKVRQYYRARLIE